MMSTCRHGHERSLTLVRQLSGQVKLSAPKLELAFDHLSCEVQADGKPRLLLDDVTGSCAASM